jgi:hypothetical protein
MSKLPPLSELRFQVSTYKDRLTALYAICLHIFHHIAYKSLKAAPHNEIPRKSILSVYDATAALSGAECAGNLLGL